MEFTQKDKQDAVTLQELARELCSAINSNCGAERPAACLQHMERLLNQLSENTEIVWGEDRPDVVRFPSVESLLRRDATVSAR